MSFAIRWCWASRMPLRTMEPQEFERAARSKKAPSLLELVPEISVVLFADVFHQFVICLEDKRHLDGPWLRVSLRIVYGDLKIQVPEVFPVKEFGHAQSVGCRLAVVIEPAAIFDVAGFDDECV